MINDNEMPVVEGTSWTGPPLHYLRHMLDILWDYISCIENVNKFLCDDITENHNY